MDLSRRALFKTENIRLKNPKTGESKAFTFRPFEIGDENDIIECIRSEYDDTYFKRDFYSAKKLREKALGDDYCFFSAVCDNRVRGIFVLSLFHDEDYVEVCSQIFHKSIRGYGLSERFTRYIVPMAKLLEPRCLFVHAVTFHPITQIVFEKLGFVPVGFRLGTFRMSICKNSYNCSKFHKQSEGVGILPVRKADDRQVFLPDELLEYAMEKYSELGAVVSVDTKKESITENNSAFTVYTDELQRMEIIRFSSYGEDIVARMRERLESHQEKEWVYQLIMPINDKAIIDAYDRLRDVGFFFTGLLPLCGDSDCIYMQYVGDLDLQLSEYSLTPEYERVLDFITFLRRENYEAKD